MTAITKQNLTMMLLGMAYPNYLSPVQLQKAVFLSQKALEEGHWAGVLQDQYEFYPYDYGPFCRDIYDDLCSLEIAKFAQISLARGPMSVFKIYGATETGVGFAKDIEKSVPAPVRDHWKLLVDWVRSQSFASLVGSIYRKYPDMAINSVFKG